MANERPDLLKSLTEKWFDEARKYSVLPLDDREWERAAERIRDGARQRYEYRPQMARIDRLMAPDITGKSFRIEAELVKGDTALNGVLLAWGSCFGGIVLYAKNQALVLEYVYSQDERVKLAVEDRLPAGKVGIVATFDRNSAGGLDLTLGGTGLREARANVPKTWPTHGTTTGISCGHDAGHPVSDAYTAPFPFSGAELTRVTLTVGERDAAVGIDQTASLFLED